MLKRFYAAAASASAISSRFQNLTRRKNVITFSSVAEAAQPFLTAVILEQTHASGDNVWILCDTEREQERFHAELSAWVPGVMLFPHLEIAAIEGAIPDAEIAAERLSVLQRIAASDQPSVVVINRRSFDEAVYAPTALRKTSVKLARGMTFDRDALVQQLVAAGYVSTVQVSQRGEFSVRGGVMDVFSWQQSAPLRTEWFDDEIESLREFDVDQQTSLRAVEHSYLLLGATDKETSHLRDYRRKTDLLLAIEIEEPEAHVFISSGSGWHGKSTDKQDEMPFFVSPLDFKDDFLSSPALRESAEKRIREQLVRWRDDGYRLLVLYRKEPELEHLKTIIGNKHEENTSVFFWKTDSNYSFVFPAERLAVITAREILAYSQAGSARHARIGRAHRGLAKQTQAIDFTELTEGELVVHLEYGLARYRGLQTRVLDHAPADGGGVQTEEVLALEFAEGAKLYVPLEQAFLVSRYVGIGKRGAALSHLGDGKWSSAKKAAEKSIYDYAAKLLKIQAVRETHDGMAFAPDGTWQKEFEEAFPYRETVDQVRAIRETKADMESGRPMDRLICGDVGFGKTEIAIRAAFKAAMSGKQVAMMVPTTVLAQQHYDNFHARMAPFPLVVELMSRYRTPSEQNRVAAGLHDGSVDLVIGTHRLISRDVTFKDLGLLIVDEEQRFGVKHKERIKERFPNVDVLTLSATPIPRTLYLALRPARGIYPPWKRRRQTATRWKPSSAATTNGSFGRRLTANSTGKDRCTSSTTAWKPSKKFAQGSRNFVHGQGSTSATARCRRASLRA